MSTCQAIIVIPVLAPRIAPVTVRTCHVPMTLRFAPIDVPRESLIYRRVAWSLNVTPVQNVMQSCRVPMTVCASMRHASNALTPINSVLISAKTVSSHRCRPGVHNRIVSAPFARMTPAVMTDLCAWKVSV